jgi:hypothetical protein
MLAAASVNSSNAAATLSFFPLSHFQCSKHIKNLAEGVLFSQRHRPVGKRRRNVMKKLSPKFSKMKFKTLTRNLEVSELVNRLKKLASSSLERFLA